MAKTSKMPSYPVKDVKPMSVPRVNKSGNPGPSTSGTRPPGPPGNLKNC